MLKSRNRILTAAIALFGLLPAAAAIADAAELTPHAAEYKVKISMLSGELHTHLSSSDGFYAAIHRIEPTGVAGLIASGAIEEKAQFRVSGDGVVPQKYASDDGLTSDKTKAQVDYDWDEGMLEGTVDGERYASPLEGPTHDRVSIQYQLMHDLLTGDPADTYILYDIDEYKTLEVSNIGTRRMRVPAGTFQVVGIQHRAQGSSRITTLWCAEELGYLPVVIEQHRKGKRRLRAELTSYTPMNESASASARADR